MIGRARKQYLFLNIERQVRIATEKCRTTVISTSAKLKLEINGNQARDQTSDILLVLPFCACHSSATSHPGQCHSTSIQPVAVAPAPTMSSMVYSALPRGSNQRRTRIIYRPRLALTVRLEVLQQRLRTFSNISKTAGLSILTKEEHSVE